MCSRSVFGLEPSQMSFLFFLMYAAAAGGVLPLLESTPGSAQEFKIKVQRLHIVHLSYFFLKEPNGFLISFSKSILKYLSKQLVFFMFEPLLLNLLSPQSGGI